MSVYEVAYHLHMPVYRLEREMPYDELLKWYAYFDKRPAGWRDDDRTSKLLQAQGVKEKPWILFPSLEKIYKRKTVSDNPLDSLGGSVMFKNMLNATGGDTIPL
jgi:hypothetical protein